MNVKVGGEYILSLEYLSTSDGGTYWLRGKKKAFVRSNGSWVHCSDGAVYALDDFRSIVETTELPCVIAHSDLIAIGRVRSVREICIELSDVGRANVYEFTMDSISVLKGTLGADTLAFQTVPIGPYFPQWRLLYPRKKMKLGETWYVFLKKGESGYYPFAGKNGLLKVEGQELIYDGVVRYPKSRVEVDAEIREASQ